MEIRIAIDDGRRVRRVPAGIGRRARRSNLYRYLHSLPFGSLCLLVPATLLVLSACGHDGIMAPCIEALMEPNFLRGLT
jgi:hypothetical protein